MLLDVLGRARSNVASSRYSLVEEQEVIKAKGSSLSLKERLDDPTFFSQYLRCKDMKLDLLANTILLDYEVSGHRVAPQKRSKYLHCAKLIILNLMLARLRAPLDFVAYSRTNGAYHGVAYKPFVRLINYLVGAEMLENYPGFKKRGEYDEIDSRLSRMRALPNFTRCYDCFGVSFSDIYLEHPPIVIRKKDSRGVEVERIPTNRARSRRIISTLDRINTQISNSDISIALTEKAKQMPSAKYNSYDERNTRLYRVFGSDELTEHGRFYGHWFQSLPRGLRRYVRIDGERIAYLDYGSCHTNIIYALNGLPPCKDAYDIGKTEISRDYLKRTQALLIHGHKGTPARAISSAINKENRKRKPWEDKIEVKKGFAQKAYDGLTTKHASISEYYGSAMAMKLMYYDSCLAEEIMLVLAREGITCIPLHDGFVVAKSHEKRLRQVMTEAYRCMFGQEPVIK